MTDGPKRTGRKRSKIGVAMNNNNGSGNDQEDGPVCMTPALNTRPLQLHRVLMKRINTPLGTMLAGAVPAGICMLEFEDPKRLEKQSKSMRKYFRYPMQVGNHPLLDQLEQQLNQYFSYERLHFDIPLVAPGSTFEARVWRELRSIPHGELVSYGEIARRIGMPRAARAVGLANSSNRISILIPCHRVIRSNGLLGGYAGGKDRKTFLINLEANI